MWEKLNCMKPDLIFRSRGQFAFIKAISAGIKNGLIISFVILAAAWMNLSESHPEISPPLRSTRQLNTQN